MPLAIKNSLYKTQINIEIDFSGLFITIETQRLLIRSYENEDFNDCISLYGDEKITKFFDHGKPRNGEEVKKIIDKKGRKYFLAGKPFGLFSIFLKDSMSFIGQIDLVPTKHLGIAEVGFILNEQFHNQGLGTEALKAILTEYIDEINQNKSLKCIELPIYKIIATAHPQNIASNKLLLKIGMNLDKIQKRFGQPRFWYSYSPASLEIKNLKIGLK
ncbi:MAG: GNAT family N-acetyltransferase [Parachlamydiales bacterium]|jgi:RimJ/RimL family protein N-acetyltransferase